MKKVVIYFILSLFMGAGVLIIAEHQHENLGVQRTFFVSDYLTVIAYNNGKYAIKNNSTGRVVGEKYDAVYGWFSGIDVIVVRRGSLKGYISAKTGEVIVEPQFHRAWANNTGTYLAATADASGKLGFIDIRTGEVVIPHQFDSSLFDDYFRYNNPGFSKNLFKACIWKNGKRICGLIDNLGNVVVPKQYRFIHLHLNNGFIRVFDHNNLVGLLDFNTKEIVIPAEYDRISFSPDEWSYFEEGDWFDDIEQIVVENIFAHRNDTTFVFDKNANFQIALEGWWNNITELNSGYFKAEYISRWHFNFGIFNREGTLIYSSGY